MKPANNQPHPGALTRRDFIKTVSIGAGVLWAGGGLSSALAAPSPAPSAPPGMERILPLEPPRVLFTSGFEEGDALPALKTHKIVSQGARTGARCLVGEIQQEKQACILEIPIDVTQGRTYVCEFYVRSNGAGTACAVWLTDGAAGKIRSLTRLDAVPRPWTLVKAAFVAEATGKQGFQIATPSSHGASPGKVWLDDLTITESAQAFQYTDRTQSFPALARDAAGALWLAALERPGGARQINLYRYDKGRLAGTWSFAPEGLTGIAAPAVCGLASGCVLAFPVERNEKWQLAYAFVRPEGQADCRVLECPGQANISPTLAAAGNRVCLAWESNAGSARGIYATWLTERGADAMERLSSPEANSYNPTLAALPDGTLHAAWDTVRGAQANIWGATCRGGKWQPERQLTRDARIERHPCLAARGGELWMAWQAQSYDTKPTQKQRRAASTPDQADALKEGIRINAVNEQRIVVARLGRDGLEMPMGLFETVSPPDALLVRPRIAFDGAGRLWLAARRSAGQHDGWVPTAWSYEEGQWSAPTVLLEQVGRWQPVTLAATPEGLAAAVQYDNIQGGGGKIGPRPDWRSGVVIRRLPARSAAPAAVNLATEPLRLPPTDFKLAAKQAAEATHLPRQGQSFGGKALTLYWGDFHDHTDLSVCARAINPPGHDLFANLRDIEQLDFAALTDHDYNFDSPQWAYNGEQTRYNHDAGRFVTFLGEEWTSKGHPPADPDKPVGPGNAQRYGHHNLIFEDAHRHTFEDSFAGEISPADLWKKLEGEEYICIPHELADWQGEGRGNPPTDWSFTNEYYQPVAEIFQARQSYEYFGAPRQSPTGSPFPGLYYLQDAWAKGIIIGVIASPDHGGGMGKAGVWAEGLTREAILKAAHARHTFGTSGAKMSLFVKAGAAMMGDKVARPTGPVTFEIEATALREIRELVIFRNNKIIHRAEPGKKELRHQWTEAAVPAEKLVWYYARIQAADGELAWSSPIWYTPK